MSFALDWLALREPADHAARDAGLLAEVGRDLQRRDAPLIVDLGCGAGSNFAALQPAAPADARWRLVDNDPALLSAAAARAPGAETLSADLAAAPLGPIFGGADLVTAAAFFDLVSADWIARFVSALPPSAGVYAALSYDGRETWRPAHETDAPVLRAFCAHQGGDKGFGPALGPKGAEALGAALSRTGRSVRAAPSPWRLKRPEDGALMDQLADGVAAAAAEAGAPDADLWRAAPRAACDIGHIDLYAAPLSA